MSLTNRVGLLAGFATVALSGVAVAETPATNSDTTMKEIAALKEELATLKAQQGDSWLPLFPISKQVKVFMFFV